MNCPQCSHELDDCSGLSPCACPGCAGVWISARALRAMLAADGEQDEFEEILGSILELDFRQSQRSCPACDGRYLKAVDIEDTELDFCAACKGLFFDPGELDRVFPGIRGSDSIAPMVDDPGFWVNLLKFIDRL